MGRSRSDAMSGHVKNMTVPLVRERAANGVDNPLGIDQIIQKLSTGNVSLDKVAVLESALKNLEWQKRRHNVGNDAQRITRSCGVVLYWVSNALAIGDIGANTAELIMSSLSGISLASLSCCLPALTNCQVATCFNWEATQKDENCLYRIEALFRHHCGASAATATAVTLGAEAAGVVISPYAALGLAAGLAFTKWTNEQLQGRQADNNACCFLEGWLANLTGAVGLMMTVTDNALGRFGLPVSGAIVSFYPKLLAHSHMGLAVGLALAEYLISNHNVPTRKVLLELDAIKKSPASKVEGLITNFREKYQLTNIDSRQLFEALQQPTKTVGQLVGRWPTTTEMSR